MDPDDKGLLSFFNGADTDAIDGRPHMRRTFGKTEPPTLEERFTSWLEITDR